MSDSLEYCTEAGAISWWATMLMLAGTFRANSKEIMALALRALLLIIVLVAPGGLLLLPILAIHPFKSSRGADATNAH